MKRQFATFRMGDALFGIDVLLVDEINRHLDIVPVAGSPEFVHGLLNLRGQIVTVIDIGAKLGAGDWKATPESRCVVLKTSRMIRHFRDEGLLDDDACSDMVGLLVDRVEDMVTVEESDIDPAPANIGDIAGKYFAGMIQLDTELLNVLRISEVVAGQSREKPCTS